MWDSGADYIDVGGESTRPGASRVPASEEVRRVVPVVERMVATGIAVSIDTTRAVVAEATVASGALLVDDVSAGLADPDWPTSWPRPGFHGCPPLLGNEP